MRYHDITKDDMLNGDGLQPSNKIIELMDQLAYQIGNDKMAEIERDAVMHVPAWSFTWLLLSKIFLIMKNNSVAKIQYIL